MDLIKLKRVKVLECCMRAFEYGGAEIMVWNWYQYFDHQKVLTDFVVNLHNNEEMNPKYEAEIKKNGGNLYQIYSKNKIIQSINRFFFMRKLAKRNYYDVIHLHVSNAFTAYLHYVAVRKYCKKIIIHSHNSNIDGNFASIKRFIHKCFRPFIRGKNIILFACSSLAAKWMFPAKYNLEKRYIIIKNGIETNKFVYNPQERNNLRKKLEIEDKFVIGHVGRFVYQKNHNFLIEVFNVFYQKNPNSMLLLIGTGELEDEMKDKVNNLGLENAVIFYGQTENVASLYQVMDYFVFPSFYEGLPITLIEAQASGLKILCSDSITLECKACSLVEFISLSESIQTWANIINLGRYYERVDVSNQIKQNKFDIFESSRQIISLYLNL